MTVLYVIWMLAATAAIVAATVYGRHPLPALALAIPGEAGHSPRVATWPRRQSRRDQARSGPNATAKTGWRRGPAPVYS